MSGSVDGATDAPANGVTTKAKMTKNQMRRAKKKEDRARERASRDTSVVTESENESIPVCRSRRLAL